MIRLSLLLLGAALTGCNSESSESSPVGLGRAQVLGIPADTPVKLKQWRSVDGFSDQVAQFESVFWDPADTISLRQRIAGHQLQGRRVLEIGTGTGLLSLCCLRADAASVVATDINPSAIANADYNAEIHGVRDRLDLRFVSSSNPGAFAVIRDDERFDLIVSNPPWEDGEPKQFSEYAYYDPQFKLLDSLLKDLHRHLTDDGRLWLAYGCVEAVRVAQRLADKYSLNLTILDDRELDSLDNLFLPGMLLEVTVNPPAAQQAASTD